MVPATPFMSQARSPGIEFIHESDGTVVRLWGEHDASNAAWLLEQLSSVVESDDANVWLDLGRVDFMAAATVGAVLEIRDRLRRLGRTLRVQSASRCVLRLLTLCELLDLVDTAACNDSGS